MGELDTIGANMNQRWNNPLDGDIYKFMDNAFTGRGGFFDGSYLVPHPREFDGYTRRKNKAYYRNFFKPVVRAMLTPVFNAPPERTFNRGRIPENSVLNAFLQNADNRGYDLRDKTEKLVQVLRLHGVAFMVMDNFPEEMRPTSIEQARRGRLFPYVYIKRRYDVYYYRTDGFGKIQTIIFNDTPVVTAAGEEKRYRGWTDTECIIYKKAHDTELSGLDALIEVERIEHGLGEVPVLVTYSVDSEDISNILDPHPPLYDLARMNWVIFQNDSCIEESKDNQGFAILYAPGAPPRNGLQIGATSIWYTGEDTPFPPGYAAPPAELLKGLREEVDALKQDFYKISEQNGVSAVTDQSGVAKQWDFQAHGWVLARTAAIANAVDWWCVRMLGLYIGQDFSGYTVAYRKSFEPRDDEKELQNLDRVIMMDIGERGNREARKRASTIALKDFVSPDVLREVHQDIDTAGFDSQQSNFDTDNE